MLGVVTHSFRATCGIYDMKGKNPNPLGPIELMHKLKAMGSQGIMFISTEGHIPNLDEGLLGEVGEEAKSLGMYLEGGSSGTEPVETERQLRATAIMGGKILKTSVGWLLHPDIISNTDEWNTFRKETRTNLKVLAKMARYWDIKIGLENHFDVTYQELAQFVDEVGSEYIGVTLDTANAFGIVQDPVETARALAPYIIATHFKDWQLYETRNGYTMRQDVLGKGEVDLKTIVPIIQAANPDVNYSIELDHHRNFEMKVLDPAYWNSFERRDPNDLVKMLNITRKANRPIEKLKDVPYLKGASIEELMEHETKILQKSMDYCVKELGFEIGRQNK